MIRPLLALAAITLLGTAATAGELVNKAAQKHVDCLVEAARKLADRPGDVYPLVKEVLPTCRQYEAELEALVGPSEARGIVSGSIFWAMEEVLTARRATQSFPMMCASVGCGMQPTVDPKTGIWRPYGR
jgi:hypothetical protein